MPSLGSAMTVEPLFVIGALYGAMRLPGMMLSAGMSQAVRVHVLSAPVAPGWHSAYYFLASQLYTMLELFTLLSPSITAIALTSLSAAVSAVFSVIAWSLFAAAFVWLAIMVCAHSLGVFTAILLGRGIQLWAAGMIVFRLAGISEMLLLTELMLSPAANTAVLIGGALLAWLAGISMPHALRAWHNAGRGFCTQVEPRSKHVKPLMALLVKEINIAVRDPRVRAGLLAVPVGTALFAWVWFRQDPKQLAIVVSVFGAGLTGASTADVLARCEAETWSLLEQSPLAPTVATAKLVAILPLVLPFVIWGPMILTSEGHAVRIGIAVTGLAVGVFSAWLSIRQRFVSYRRPVTLKDGVAYSSAFGAIVFASVSAYAMLTFGPAAGLSFLAIAAGMIGLTAALIRGPVARIAST